MPFNSDTYHANKHRREAKAELTRAKEIRSRARYNEAADWEVAIIPGLVRSARLNMRISRAFRLCAEGRRHNA